jgi:CcmD family protein
VSQNLGFLFAAFAVTWAGFFVYLFLVHRVISETRKRLALIEKEAGSFEQD